MKSENSLYHRAAQKLNLGAATKQKSSKNNTNKGMTNKNNAGKRGGDTTAESTRNIFLMNTSEMIMRTPPHAPPSLFKHGVSRRGDCHGKVRDIFLNIFNSIYSLIL